MSDLRRYEILVPLLFNDGRPVPEPLLAQTFAELRERFGGSRAAKEGQSKCHPGPLPFGRGEGESSAALW